MLITVEVAGKFGPKVNGEWIGIDRDSGLKPSDFVAGQTYNVETKPYTSKSGKKGINIVAIKEDRPVKSDELKKVSNEIAREYTARATKLSTTPTVIETAEDRKSRRILYQGILQAALQSPSLAGLPATNVTEFMALVKEVVRQSAEFVTEEAR